jgi:hypothetical protein
VVKLYEKNVKNFFFLLSKSLKKGVGSGVESGSGSISQRYGSGSSPTCHGSPTLPLRLIWLFDDAVQAVIGMIWSETV